MKPSEITTEIHPLVKLASSAVPGERKYVLLIGAGVSRDAGLPTAWDLMLATTSRLLAGEKGDFDSDPETWFRKSQYSQLSYSELIGSLFTTTVEQQQFMREQLKAEKPGNAHRLAANLAQMGVIRYAITTNFDSLLEQAIEETGLNVQVIANENDLHHSEPLIHCKSFRVYKPHGTLGVGLIRNTPADIKQLAPEMEEELVRVMSDHGLMVLGYAGEDEGILRCFKQKRSFCYPTFWINPNPPIDSIPALFRVETFHYLYCKGASAFLNDLLEMYKKLAALAPAAGLAHSLVEIRDALVGVRSDLVPLVKHFLKSLARDISAIAPDFTAGGKRDELLVQAIDKSLPIVTASAQVGEDIATEGSSTAAMAFYKNFGKILEGYNYPRGSSGFTNPSDFDFHKFIGHELFVTFFSSLIAHERWQIFAELLDEQIYVKNVNGNRQDLVSFTYASEYVRLLNGTRQADLLKLRHTEGDLSQIAPFQQIVDADLFLYLRAEMSRDASDTDLTWYPCSIWHMVELPKYLIEARRIGFASHLLHPFGVMSIPELRDKYTSAATRLNKLFDPDIGNPRRNPLFRIEPSTLGTR